MGRAECAATPSGVGCSKGMPSSKAAPDGARWALSFHEMKDSSVRKDLAGGQKVTAACLNCHNCHLACDMGRPCKKCTRLGVTCVERTLFKKRGRKPKPKNGGPM